MLASGQVARARRRVQEQMVDSCVIRSLIRSTTIDEHTGEYLMVPDPTLPDPIYSGVCKLTLGALQVRDVDSQGQDLAVADATLSIPVTAAGSRLVGKDHVATITLSRYDTGVITAVVQAGHAQTFATARRFPVEITT